MARYIGIRLAQAFAAVLAVVLATFMLFKLTPGDPVLNILGPRSSLEARQQLRDKLGLDDGVLVQFARYVGRVLRGDLGASNKSAISVTGLLIDRMRPTLLLVVAGTFGTVVITVVLAVVAALRRDTHIDHTIRVTSLVGLFLPTFWIGYVLLTAVALRTGWFPVSGLEPGFWGTARSLVLPTVTLAIGLSPVLLRSLRSSMISILESEHVAAARSLGLSRARVIRRHVMRNAAVPTISLLTTAVGFLLFGVVVLETTFDIHGLGSALATAAAQRDLPVLQGITLVFAVGVVLINLVGDLVTAALDPRIRLR